MSLHSGDRRFRLFAISGSLRRVSASSSLLRHFAEDAPPDASIVLFKSLALIPPFNPDEEGNPAPDAVAELRAAIAAADGVLFSTPEYAHGVPGVLKNALDWLVGSGELYEKPVAIVQPSARGAFARASLAETLKVMGAQLAGEFIVDPAPATASIAEILATLAGMRK
jgi:NAD(P)H-dependent FMN reductase